jgi:hypothetical protein
LAEGLESTVEEKWHTEEIQNARRVFSLFPRYVLPLFLSLFSSFFPLAESGKIWKMLI